MTIAEALKCMGITNEEFSHMVVVKLSRLFAKRRVEITDTEESNHLIEAFNVLKQALIEQKAAPKTFEFPKDFFPTVKKLSSKTEILGTTLGIKVDGILKGVAAATYSKGTMPILLQKSVQSHDTLIFLWEGSTYNTEILVKNLTQGEYQRSFKK